MHMKVVAIYFDVLLKYKYNPNSGNVDVFFKFE